MNRDLAACVVNLFQLSQFCPLIFDLRIWFPWMCTVDRICSACSLWVSHLSTTTMTSVVFLLCKLASFQKKRMQGCFSFWIIGEHMFTYTVRYNKLKYLNAVYFCYITFNLVIFALHI